MNYPFREHNPVFTNDTMDASRIPMNNVTNINTLTLMNLKDEVLTLIICAVSLG